MQFIIIFDNILAFPALQVRDRLDWTILQQVA